MKSLDKDLWREVRNTRSRFLSIMVLVALAVAFLSGLRCTAPDMKNTLDEYMDANSFMDIQVLSTLGLTQEDVDAMCALESISRGEGSYQLDAYASGPDTDMVVKLWSLPEEINLISVRRGRMPRSADECLADKKLLSGLGLSVGDYITLSLEEDADADEDEAPSLRFSRFRIVGEAVSSYYISVERGTSSIGTGSVSAFVYLPPDSFDMDYFTAAYFLAEGAGELVAFSDEYTDKIDDIIDSLEAFGDERARLRTEKVLGEARDKINDAQAELDDAKKDADKELADARRELADGRKELDDGYIELEDAKRTLDEELADAEQEIADARAELADAKKQLVKALGELQDGEAEYRKGLSEYEDGLKEYEDGRKAYYAGVEEMNDAKARLDSARAALDGLSATADGLSAQKSELEQNAAGLGYMISISSDPARQAAYQSQLDAVNEGISRINENLEPLQQGIAQGEAEYGLGIQALTGGKKKLHKAKDILEEAKTELENAKTELEDGRRELDDGWQEYYDGLREYEDGLKELDDAVAELNDKVTEARQEIADAEVELADGEKEYRDGLREYEDGRREAEEKIADAQAKLDDAAEKLSEIDDCEWYILSRDSNPGYLGFGQDADRMANLAKVFPMLFFLVAALVCLTTMTRMVDEQRIQIGSLKAMGYSSFDISKKYLAYGALPALAGGLLGLVIGYTLFPTMIFTAYQIMYEVPSLHLRDYAGISVSCMGAALACTTLATLWACLSTLRSVPAELMRPKAPAAGRRVLLEYISPLWSRLGFFGKLTARNLFRYQKRFWMTIIGIGGCTALIIAGFGLRSSLMTTMDRQYSSIFNYTAQVNMASDPSEEDRAVIEEYISSNPSVTGYMPCVMNSVDCESDAYRTSGVIQVCSPDQIGSFVELRRFADGSPITLDDSGVVIDQKLSELLKIGPGDSFIVDNDGRYQVRVSAVTEHYLGHYVYMTPACYEELWGRSWNPNAYIMQFADASDELCNSVFSDLMKLDNVGAATRVADTRDTYLHSMERIDFVVVIVILSAAALAVVVLYNLSNINITERRRELATIKVLGFYDKEVSAYVYRENIVLTVLGIALGIVMGRWLHSWLIKSVEIDLMMFGRDTDPMSCVYAGILTAVFSAAVNVMAHFKMKEIDMVESLKSAE